VRDAWDIVWGPACCRAPVTVFDDTLVYVVRCRLTPARYVVVIRGTNPVSAFDWLFGDLWTGRVTPWSYANQAGSISLSAALGLAIIRNLRAAGPQTEPAALAVSAAVDTGVGTALAASHSLSQWLSGMERAPVSALRERFVTELQGLVEHGSAAPLETAEHRVQALAAFWQSGARQRLLDLIDEAARLTGRLDLAVFVLVEDEIRLRISLGAGVDLRTFLASAVKQAGDSLDIVVTGHSKGGGLASTVALWLADTQGTKVAETEQWDPKGRATIRCFSYAGPTAGDEAFAGHSNSVIGAQCRRIANSLDIVPQAWAVRDLRKIPGLYAPSIAPIPGMADLIEIIASKVAPLRYSQVATDEVFAGKVNSGLPLFLAQVVYQHLEAYLEALGLTAYGITTATFFDPTQFA
ncbi:MAG TPA: hypothetical protein VF311_06380, partial [Terriglobales bacterium]